jgi:MATE family multidrug resistance protein
VASGALRGVGVTRWSMGAHLISHWLVGFPLGLFLGFGLGMGPAGLWWGLTAGLGAAAISLSVKFFRVSAGSIEALRVD